MIKQTPESIYTSICFFREKKAQKPIMVVIVEGETDKNLFNGKLIKNNYATEVIVAGNKRNALKVIKLSQEGNQTLSPMICVVDADYDRLDDRIITLEEVVYTDANDMECTILNVDDILCRVVNEIFPAGQIKKMLENLGYKTITDFVIDRAYEIGKYRAVSYLRKLSIDFKPHDDRKFTAFYNQDNFHWNDDEFRNWLSGNPKNNRKNLEILFNNVNHLPGTVQKWDFCRGHDVIKVLELILNHFATTTKWDSTQLEQIIRLAVKEDRLQDTKMAKKVYKYLDQINK